MTAAERGEVADGDRCENCRCELYGHGTPQCCRDCGGEGLEREKDPQDVARERREREWAR